MGMPGIGVVDILRDPESGLPVCLLGARFFVVSSF